MPRLARYPSCDRVRSVRGKLEPDVADGQRSANAPSQGRQDVLSAAVLAFREPLAQLAGDRAGHTVALEPSEQFLLAGGEFHALQVPYPPGRAGAPSRNPRDFASSWPIAGVIVPRRGNPTSAPAVHGSWSPSQSYHYAPKIRLRYSTSVDIFTAILNGL